MQWFRMDLHLHTPGSSDFQEPDVSYVDILRQAEMRGLDIIAFTDHNTVAGYQAMMEEIDELEYLEKLGRIQPDEKRKLAEYRRLLDKILVLPGFEFTATFGFHILGIFSPETPVRQLEHILLSLNIPPDHAGRRIVDGGRVVGRADRLPDDQRGGRDRDRGARQFESRRRHARLRFWRADQDRLHAGLPSCTRSK